jgi:hypothetical protein
MIIVFSGGLGNQMFQYAFYLAKKKTAPDVYINTYSIWREGLHNGFELDRLFGIKADNSSITVCIVRKLLIFKRKKPYKTVSSLLLRVVKTLTNVKIMEEKGYSRFDSEYLKPCQGFVLYFGYWQSPLYFNEFSDEIRRKFSFDEFKLSGQSRLLLSSIRSVESVSIHIRRGDFLAKGFDNAVCTKSYYLNAICLISSKINDPCFVFFSDDPEWVKENIPLLNAVYVDWNQGANSWEDLYLMSQCRHNIIANSTFSWWGAWLNSNEEKLVIVPARFLKNEETPDIYPENWITIHSL